MFCCQRLSLLPTPSSHLSPTDPELGPSFPAPRPRSGSRGIGDFFRIRKKSSTIPPNESKDVRLKSPPLSPVKSSKHQRSKSTVEPPVLSSDLRHQWKETEPIAVRVFNLKRDLQVPDITLSLTGTSCPTEHQATPMSELLSVQAASASASKPAFGIKDFLQLYNSQSSSESRREERRSPTRSVSFSLYIVYLLNTG